MRRTVSRCPAAAAGAAGILAAAAAIEIGSLVRIDPFPTQLPGYAKTIGLNPSADILRLSILCLLPFLAGLAIARIASRWSTRRLPTLTHPAALAISMFIVTGSAAAGYGLRPAVVIGSISGAAALLFRRFFALLFRQDRIALASIVATALLAWAFVAEPLAHRGWMPFETGACLFVWVVVEALAIGRGDLERGAGSLAVSALTLPVAFFGSRPKAISWLAGTAVLVLPLIGSLWAERGRRRKLLLRLLSSYVLLPGAIVALAATVCLRVPPVADIFEDGHGLLPASEYLRGEMPYRDIVPGHGLLSDGGLHATSLRVFGDDYKGLRRGMKVVGAFFWPAIYFVGFAATGSAAVGFWTLLLSFLWFPQYMFLRVIGSLAALALASAAARTGRRGFWFAAGAALPVAILLSVDFALYAASGCAVAIVVSRRGWRAGAGTAAAGFLCGLAAVGLPFAATGILPSFLSTTFVDLGRLMPVYALGFHVGFSEIRAWLSGWSFLLNRESFFGCVLLGTAVVVALLGARFPRLGTRGRALAPVLAWFLAAVLSVIERHHFEYPAFVLPLVVVLAARWAVGHSGWGSVRAVFAATVLAALLFGGSPAYLAAAVADALQTIRVPAGVAELATPRRARGALFTEVQRTVVLRTDEYLRSRRFGASDTWLDFSNSPGLYYLFDKDCPIRYYEVPFYETESAQTQVIEAVRANRHVRSVLLGTGLWFNAIDGIPNFQRASRVGQFIRREFHPAYLKDGVEFWERNSP